MYRPLMIGMLLSKDDRDIIEEVMTEYSKQLDSIFCIESSDDDSLDVIRSFPNVEYAVHARELGIEVSHLKDGVRQFLLSHIQDRYGYDGWIFPIQSDEIYAGELANLVHHANATSANVLNALVAQFVIHRDEAGTNFAPGGRSIQDMRRWYFFGQCEVAGFKNQPGIYYNLFEHMRVLVHGLHPVATCGRVVVRKHYNMRTPQQLASRIADRLKTGWQVAYAALIDDPFVDNPLQVINAGVPCSPL